MRPERALIVCAHDDDEVIGCGGTIRKLVNEGTKVTTLVFATGNEGYTELAERDKIVERRKKERANAQKILGTTTCTAYEYHDFDNLDCEHVYRAVMRAVREIRPHLVLTHYPAEYLAHRTLAEIAPEAIMQAAWRCSLDLGEPWAVEKILQFSILDMIPEPTHIIDITETFDDKIRAMKAFESQLKLLGAILQALEGKALYYGSLIGVKYAEAFALNAKVPQREV